MPLSLTLSSTCEFTRCRRTWILPPFGVNLIALLKRFHKICCHRPGSPEIMPSIGSKTLSNRMLFVCAVGAADSIAVLTTSTRANSLHIQSDSARNDLTQIKQVFDELRLRARVAFDDLRPA